MLMALVNVYRHCKNMSFLFDVLLITSWHDIRLFFMTPYAIFITKSVRIILGTQMGYNLQKLTQR